jgi:hypothetical protein
MPRQNASLRVLVRDVLFPVQNTPVNIFSKSISFAMYTDSNGSFVLTPVQGFKQNELVSLQIVNNS